MNHFVWLEKPSNNYYTIQKWWNFHRSWMHIQIYRKLNHFRTNHTIAVWCGRGLEMWGGVQNPFACPINAYSDSLGRGNNSHQGKILHQLHWKLSHQRIHCYSYCYYHSWLNWGLQMTWMIDHKVPSHANHTVSNCLDSCCTWKDFLEWGEKWHS